MLQVVARRPCWTNKNQTTARNEQLICGALLSMIDKRTPLSTLAERSPVPIVHAPVCFARLRADSGFPENSTVSQLWGTVGRGSQGPSQLFPLPEPWEHRGKQAYRQTRGALRTVCCGWYLHWVDLSSKSTIADTTNGQQCHYYSSIIVLCVIVVCAQTTINRNTKRVNKTSTC